MRALSAKASVQNRLLGSLSSEEHDRVKVRLQAVQLPRGRIIYEAGDLADYAYFPLSGVISFLSSTEAGEVIEVGMVGNEGTTGIPVITHAQEMPYRAVVQLPVEALRMETRAFRDEFIRGGQLHNLVVCYSHSLFAQIAQSAVCNRFHTMEQRFCRWLLCMHDRTESDTLDLTHEIIANMLGAQRVVVTNVAGAIQRAGLIKHSRGSITILDRQGVERVTCECYRTVKHQVRQCLAA